MNNILITGMCGVIGKSLIDNLDNCNITGIDNMLTQRYCSLFYLPKNIKFIESGFENLTVDFLNNFDTVIHLAGIIDAANSFNYKDEVQRVNVDLTKLFFEKINQSKIKLIIFPSSTSVYGKALSIVHENSNAINPQSPYAESKLAIEEFLQQGNISVPYIIFRFGTIFGPVISYRVHTAINKFCYQAAFGQPLTVWKEAYEFYRPYLGLEDACTAVQLALNNELPLNNIYNVLTGNYKLEYIIDIIKGYVPNTKINLVNTPLLNQFQYEVSDAKIRKYGYYNKTSLEEGIKETLKLLGAI